MALEEYSCEACGLIWHGEALNFVEGDTTGLVGNYCPNCGKVIDDAW